MRGTGAGVVMVLVALVALAPWWLRGDAPRARARFLASDGASHGALVGRPTDGDPGGGAAALAPTPPGGGGAVDPEVVLALVAAACRSGASVARALDAVGAALGGGLVLGGRRTRPGSRVRAAADGEVLRSAASRLALGAPWDDAWGEPPGDPWVGSVRAPSGRGTRSRHPGPSGRATPRVLREALRPTWEHGAPPEPALRAATDQLRRDRAERSATAAGRLGVRLVLPLGLCYLPAFVLVGLVPVLVSYGVGLLGSA